MEYLSVQSLWDVDFGHKWEINLAHFKQSYQSDQAGNYDSKCTTGFQSQDTKSYLLHFEQTSYDFSMNFYLFLDAIFHKINIWKSK